MNPDIADNLLERFDVATQAAYVNVGGATISILWTLAGIAVAVAVVWNMFGGKTPWMALFSKFILIGFFVWLVEAWPAVTEQIQETFIQIGLLADNSSMSAADFMRPSQIGRMGDEVTGVLFKRADEVTFSFSITSGFSGKISEWLAFWLAGWAVTIAYWFASLMIFASRIVFFVSSIMALFMTAFMVFGATAWMGRGALGWLISSGLMLCALAVVTSIAVPVFRGLTLDVVDEYAANQALLASLTLIASVIGAGVVARGIGNGIASWGMGSALSVASSAAIAGTAAVAGAAMVAGPAARAAMGQMAASRTAAAGGPRISMNSPASYATAGKIEDMSLKGRAAMAGRGAAGASSSAASPASAASGSQPASRGLRQLQQARLPAPSVSSILMARSAVPDIADDGPSMTPDRG